MSSSTVLSRSSDRIEHKSSSWDLCSSCSKILARYINSSWSNGWEAAYGWTAAPLVLVLALVVEASYLYLSIAPACSVLVLAAWLIVSSLLYLCTDGGNKEVESWNKYGKSEPWPWAGACANGNCETAADDADAAAAMPTWALLSSLEDWKDCACACACASTREDVSLAATATFFALSAAFKFKACWAKASALAVLLTWVRSISLSRWGLPRRKLLCRQPSIVTVRTKPQMFSCRV